jgi:hypothetical protein
VRVASQPRQCERVGEEKGCRGKSPSSVANQRTSIHSSAKPQPTSLHCSVPGISYPSGPPCILICSYAAEAHLGAHLPVLKLKRCSQGRILHCWLLKTALRFNSLGKLLPKLAPRVTRLQVINSTMQQTSAFQPWAEETNRSLNL